MLNKHYRTLELHKILEMLANECASDDCRKMALELEPQTDFDEVQDALTRTFDAYGLSLRFGSPTFYRIVNPSDALHRAKAGAVLMGREFLDIADVLRQIRSLCQWNRQCENAPTSISYLFAQLTPYTALEKRISEVFVSEDQLADDASPALLSIRRKIANAGLRIREQLDRMIRSTSMQKILQEQLVTIRDGRYVVPVKSEHRGEVQGLIHDTSSSGSTVFIEPMGVVQANNEIRVLKSQEAIEIENILGQLSEECAQQADAIIANYQTVLTLNLYFAKASLASRMKASCPRLTHDRNLMLKNARHPLIPAQEVVPVDIAIGKDYSTLVITGPNTGGKTVSLKTAGLLVAMTMCGLMIPVSEPSEVSVFDQILVDIGDEQSIEQSLSTFSAHMTNIISILEHVDGYSLVLLDELGSGTDPVEGAALAVSILERLHKYGARTFATTHYQEIKTYALTTPGVENACCEFDVVSLKPTYRLLIGIPGKSNAFAISSRLGLDDEIIEHAKSLIDSEQRRFEDVVAALEQSRLEYDRLKDEIEVERREARNYRLSLEAQLSELEQERVTQLERAKGEATRIIESVRAQSEAILDELNEIRRQKESENFSQMVSGAKSRTRNRLDRLYDSASPVRKGSAGQEEYRLPRPLKKGDTVLVTDIDKKATLLTDPDDNGNVLVQAGIIKTRVPVSGLRLLEEEKVKLNGGRTVKSVRSKLDREAKMDLDIRGQTAEEGILELDRFIDNALLTGIGTITVIHGKGTGALRNAIRQHLRGHKNVRSFRPGVYGEGEDGVTIAELK